MDIAVSLAAWPPTPAPASRSTCSKALAPLLALLAAMTGCSTVRVGPASTESPASQAAKPASNTETSTSHAAAAKAAPKPAAKPAPAAAPAPAAPPADAQPRVERIASGHPNRPYVIRGQEYDPHDSDVPMREVGLASWYGHPFHGRLTSNGERYDMHTMTAAHKTMPLPSYARVRNLSNGREVVVRVNDRGPFYSGRVIDLSLAAAKKLGMNGAGTARVEVERITNEEIKSGAWKQDTSGSTLARGRGAGRVVEQQAALSADASALR